MSLAHRRNIRAWSAKASEARRVARFKRECDEAIRTEEMQSLIRGMMSAVFGRVSTLRVWRDWRSA